MTFSFIFLKSTISISLLYLVFRMLMRKETFFKLNRALLLSVVVCSAIHSAAIPAANHSANWIQNEWMPRLQNPEITTGCSTTIEGSTQQNFNMFQQNKQNTIIREEFPWIKLLQTCLSGRNTHHIPDSDSWYCLYFDPFPESAVQANGWVPVADH